MFDTLTDKLQGVFASIRGKRNLTEENVKAAVSEVRMALLDADVNYGVIKNFLARVKEKALGETVLKAVRPGEQFIQILHDSLVDLMGSRVVELQWNRRPTFLMVCGLQGSGKTTFCAKLACLLKDKKVLLVACDRQRPAAIEQLKVLAGKVGCSIFSGEGEMNPLKVAEEALGVVRKGDYDVVIFDTAGRLHVDEELMKELESLKKKITPHYVLFVANAMIGQDAANVARQFHEKMAFDGTVLTMLDAESRGGAALSIVEVTGKPLLFEGVGEKLEDLQPFHPRSMADRILGMGDTINLVRKARDLVSEKEAADLEEKIRKVSFTYEDFLKQFGMVKKMGSLKSILKMIPGASALKDLPLDEEEMMKNEAIILSMTPEERREKKELIMPRRRRIAKGSGTTLDEVNRLIKNFNRTKQMMKTMPKGKKLENLLGGMKWQ